MYLVLFDRLKLQNRYYNRKHNTKKDLIFFVARPAACVAKVDRVSITPVNFTISGPSRGVLL